MWILLIVVILIACFYYYKGKEKLKVKKNHIDKAFEYVTLSENKGIDLEGPINEEIEHSLDDLEDKLTRSHNINDIFYELNKALSNEHINDKNYVRAHEIYRDLSKPVAQYVNFVPEMIAGVEVPIDDLFRGINLEEQAMLLEQFNNNIIHNDRNIATPNNSNSTSAIRKNKKKVHVKPKFNYKMRSDPNNVHDRTFNEELANQYEYMRDHTRNVKVPPMEIFLANLHNKKVDRFLNRDMTTQFRDLGSEREIYNNVWKRIHTFEGPQKDELIESFVLAVKDSVRDDGYVHCVNGRVGRIFSSLAVADPVFGTVRTDDVIKKEAFDKAGELRTKYINGHLKDPRYAKAAESWLKPGIKPDPKIEEEFEEKMKDYISSEITKDYSALRPELFTNIMTSIMDGFE